MKVNGKSMRSIWPIEGKAVGVIDQRALPYRLEFRVLDSAAAVEDAICTMVVRGAPLIGVAGAYGLALSLRSVYQRKTRLGSWSLAEELSHIAVAKQLKLFYDEILGKLSSRRARLNPLNRTS